MTCIYHNSIKLLRRIFIADYVIDSNPHCSERKNSTFKKLLQYLAVLFIRKKCIFEISPILKLLKVKDLGKMLHFLNWLLNSDGDAFLCNILPNFRMFFISRLEFHCNIFVNPQLSHLIV